LGDKIKTTYKMSDNTLIKLKATADILGGDVFYATETGVDPEHTSNNDLLPNGMYIRLQGSDGSLAYISAYELDKVIELLETTMADKADRADVEAIQLQMEGKAADTDIELLQGELSNKASKTELEAALETIGNMASQTQIDELQTAVAGKAASTDVAALQEEVAGKAASTDVATLIADLEALEAIVANLNDANSIAAINSQIAYLNTEINKKLTIDDLRTINTTISALNDKDSVLTDRVEALEVNLNKKATTTYVQTQINDVNSVVSTISRQIADKADKTDLTVKANKTDFDNAVRRIAATEAAVGILESNVQSNYTELSATINRKANKAEIDQIIAAINSGLTGKVDKSSYNDEVARLDNKINTLEATHAGLINDITVGVDEFECDVNNTISELRASLNTQGRQITQQDTKITKLQESSNTYNERLKQNWVRVLSTNEYKSLRAAPEGVPYNDRYRYPNIVYLVVDFNKPKAIYIGDIMVAQAESSGSIGFAYTFPIIF
jgi:hypothetical protein